MSGGSGIERGPVARTIARALAVTAALLLAALAAAGCGDDDSGSETTVAKGEPIDLELLVYNIEYGGGPATDAVIREIDADVVGVLESYERLDEIAERTGYPYYNTSLQLLSKYPILEPSGGDGLYGLIEVEPGYVIPFFNDHLDYVEWGPERCAKGESVESVIETENEVRTSAFERPMESMAALLDEGYPVFATGDYNQPSSLDYTEETAGSRKEIPEPVAWPVSEKLFELGFRDTYREIHPDPVADPAITQERTGERIDYVYAAGPSTTLDSKLVGEPGGEDVDIEAAPWTSDHRAVVSSFEVTPVAMPTLVAVDAQLGTVGDEITVTYNAPGSSDNEIAIVPEGGETGDALETLAARRTSGARRSSTPPAGIPLRTRPCCSTPTEARSRASPSTSATRRRARADDRQAGLRVRRADRRLLDPGPRQPLGLARGLRGLGLRPGVGRLPDLGLRRGSLRRHRAAADRRRGDARAREPGQAVAAPARRLRRPLPARRRVRVRRQRRVQRRRRLARAGAAASRAARRRPSPGPSAAASAARPPAPGC